MASDVVHYKGMGPAPHLNAGWDSLLLKPLYFLASALGGLTSQHWLVENAAPASTKHKLYAVCLIHQIALKDHTQCNLVQLGGHLMQQANNTYISAWHRGSTSY